MGDNLADHELVVLIDMMLLDNLTNESVLFWEPFAPRERAEYTAVWTLVGACKRVVRRSRMRR